MRGLWLALLCLVACESRESRPDSGIDPPTEAEQRIESVESQCIDYCWRLANCYEAVCNEDYPGSATPFIVSVTAQGCIDEACKTDLYWRFTQDDQEYLRCIRESSCRAAITGSCGLWSHCGTEGLDPHPPDAGMSAPIPDAD
jgi:hypothetical protein